MFHLEKYLTKIASQLKTVLDVLKMIVKKTWIIINTII